MFEGVSTGAIENGTEEPSRSRARGRGQPRVSLHGREGYGFFASNSASFLRSASISAFSASSAEVVAASEAAG